MADFTYQQWRNSNSKGKYPFLLSAELNNGEVFFADNTFADARLYPEGGRHDQYISKVVKTGDDLTIHISDGTTQDLCTGSYSFSSLPSLITLEDTYGRQSGVLVTDSVRLTVFNGWPIGTHEFTQEQTAFDPVVVTPMPDTGLKSLRADETQALYGETLIVGGHGVILEVDETDPENPIITVNAVGEPLAKRLVCDSSVFSNPCVLKTINGIEPDEYGNFVIGNCGVDATNSIIRVEPTANGIHIKTVGGRFSE
jgi:hypothetical protein